MMFEWKGWYLFVAMFIMLVVQLDALHDTFYLYRWAEIGFVGRE